jgi:hypothetical protein
MPSKRSLRVVAPDEAPDKRLPMSVTAAASDGDRLDLLIAMRARVARDVEDENTPARDLAALTRRLLEIVNDIEAIRLANLREAQRAGIAEDEPFDAAAI